MSLLTTCVRVAMKYSRCIECDRRSRWMVGEDEKGNFYFHPSGLCKRCYDVFKQRLRDGDVQGGE